MFVERSCAKRTLHQLLWRHHVLRVGRAEAKAEAAGCGQPVSTGCAKLILGVLLATELAVCWTLAVLLEERSDQQFWALCLGEQRPPPFFSRKAFRCGATQRECGTRTCQPVHLRAARLPAAFVPIGR